MDGAKLGTWVVRHKAAVLAAVGALTVVAAVGTTRLAFDSSIDSWFLEDDEDLLVYRAFLDRFQADELVVAGVFAPDVYAPHVLAAVDRFTEAARKAPFARRAVSLSTIRIPRSVDDDVEIAPLIRALPKNEAEAAAIRDEANHYAPLEALVAPDGRATAILVELAGEGANFDGKVALVSALRELAQAETKDGITIVLAGSPAFDDAFYRYTIRDFMTLGPISFALVMIAVFFVFRRVTGALIPFSVVAVANLWTFGLMGWVGFDIDLMSSGLAGLILAVGIADSIHVQSEYYQSLVRGRDREAAVIESVAHLLTPCFFTSATTVAGMLSLLVGDLAPIRRFGLLSAAGVGFAFVLSLTLVPALLAWVAPPDPAYLGKLRTSALTSLLDRLGRPTRRTSAVIVTISIALSIASVFAITQLDVGSNALNYFKKNDPVRVATERIDSALGGSATIELLLDTPNSGFLDPKVLARVADLQDRLRTIDGVTHVNAATDLLVELRRVMSATTAPASWALLPDSRAMAAQLYLLLEEDEDFASWVQDEYGVGRITARVQMTRAKKLLHDLPQIEAELVSRGDSALTVQMTGFVKLMGEMELYIVDSQIRSLSIAFLVITLMMVMLLRSVRLGLFSMIPNFLPILLGLGVMAPLDIALDPGTAMIGSIALGLVVDDTVHFLVRFRRAASQGASTERAIAATLRDAGRPIIVTSLVLSTGFSVLALGSFTPNIYFGTLTSLVVMLALVADLVVLPAALILIRPKV